jgi:hypothetical protein
MTILNESLASFDPDIAALIDSELHATGEQSSQFKFRFRRNSQGFGSP